jgi:hypothetical protein
VGQERYIRSGGAYFDRLIFIRDSSGVIHNVYELMSKADKLDSAQAEWAKPKKSRAEKKAELKEKSKALRVTDGKIGFKVGLYIDVDSAERTVDWNNCDTAVRIVYDGKNMDFKTFEGFSEWMKRKR